VSVEHNTTGFEIATDKLSLVQEFVQENQFGRFASAQLIALVWTEPVHMRRTSSSPSEDATEVSSCKIKFRTSESRVKACLWDCHNSAAHMDEVTSRLKWKSKNSFEWHWNYIIIGIMCGTWY